MTNHCSYGHWYISFKIDLRCISCDFHTFFIQWYLYCHCTCEIKGEVTMTLCNVNSLLFQYISKFIFVLGLIDTLLNISLLLYKVQCQIWAIIFFSSEMWFMQKLMAAIMVLKLNQCPYPLRLLILRLCNHDCHTTNTISYPTAKKHLTNHDRVSYSFFSSH